MGVLDIGENPKAMIPSCRTYRESVAAGKISGLFNLPPAFVTASFRSPHHGFELSAAVTVGRPFLSRGYTFSENCKQSAPIVINP